VAEPPPKFDPTREKETCKEVRREFVAIEWGLKSSTWKQAQLVYDMPEYTTSPR